VYRSPTHPLHQKKAIHQTQRCTQQEPQIFCVVYSPETVEKNGMDVDSALRDSRPGSVGEPVAWGLENDRVKEKETLQDCAVLELPEMRQLKCAVRDPN
jgi:hypothetical protein